MSLMLADCKPFVVSCQSCSPCSMDEEVVALEIGVIRICVSERWTSEQPSTSSSRLYDNSAVDGSGRYGLHYYVIGGGRDLLQVLALWPVFRPGSGPPRSLSAMPSWVNFWYTKKARTIQRWHQAFSRVSRERIRNKNRAKRDRASSSLAIKA